MMSPTSTDFSPPVQGLVNHSYDQSIVSLSRARKRREKKRRIAALVRLVLAVAERRRLDDAELRDLLAVQPDDAARAALLDEVAAAEEVGWESAGEALALARGKAQRAAGPDEEPEGPCDHCGEEDVHGDGCQVGEVAGQPVGDGWTTSMSVDGVEIVVRGPRRAVLARQLDLPLAADQDGRAKP